MPAAEPFEHQITACAICDEAAIEKDRADAYLYKVIRR